MPRRLPAPLALLLAALAGCASPAVLTASAPAGPDALDCALDEANVRGYVIDWAEPDIYVRLRQTKRYRFGLSDPSEFDVLTASAPRRRLTVTATAEDDAGDPDTQVVPSRQARDDAQAIVDACAD